MTMITPSYLGETIEYSSLHACRSTLEDPTPTAFEVASVKANTSGSAAWSMRNSPGGRFNFDNATLDTIVRWAYRLQDYQLAGTLSWTSSDRFDIVARAGGNPLPDETGLQAMMQSLLAERFKLAVHHEARELPIYALVLARADGKWGPELHPSSVDCAAIAAAFRTGAAPPSQGSRPICGIRMAAGSMVGGGITMARLAPNLTRLVSRVVVDHTGLTGAVDLDLHWTPDQTPSPDPTPADTNAPSIFTALQEQLGLKLESTKGPVDVLVIDHVEKPTPD